MTKENITWRTFDDDGNIYRQWNRPASPSMIIIDHKGTIRRKWVGKVGEKTIDSVLEKLIQEVQSQ